MWPEQLGGYNGADVVGGDGEWVDDVSVAAGCGSGSQSAFGSQAESVGCFLHPPRRIGGVDGAGYGGVQWAVDFTQDVSGDVLPIYEGADCACEAACAPGDFSQLREQYSVDGDVY